jgi:hypothetical protein
MCLKTTLIRLIKQNDDQNTTNVEYEAVQVTVMI